MRPLISRNRSLHCFPKSAYALLSFLLIGIGSIRSVRASYLYFDANGNDPGAGVVEGQVYEWSTTAPYWSISPTSFSSSVWIDDSVAYFSAGSRSTSESPLTLLVGEGGVSVSGLVVNNCDVTISADGGALSTTSSVFTAAVAYGKTLTWEDGLSSAPTDFQFKQSGGTLVLGGLPETTSSVTINNGTMVLNGLPHTTLLVKIDSGILQLTGDSVLSADMDVSGNSGQLQLLGTTQSVGTLAMENGNVFLGGGTLTSRSWESGSVDLGDGGVFTVSDPEATADTVVTVTQGAVSGTGNFIKDGLSILKLGPSVSLDFTGDVLVKGGVLERGDSYAEIDRDYQISTGATLRFSQLYSAEASDPYELTIPVYGSGTLELNSSGSIYGIASLKLGAGGSLDETLSVKTGKTDVFDLNGQSITLASVDGTVILPETSTLTLNDSSFHVSPVGSGSIIKTGDGAVDVWWPSGESYYFTHQYIGLIHVESGTLNLQGGVISDKMSYPSLVEQDRPTVMVDEGATLSSTDAWVSQLTGSGNVSFRGGYNSITVGTGKISYVVLSFWIRRGRIVYI